MSSDDRRVTVAAVGFGLVAVVLTGLVAARVRNGRPALPFDPAVTSTLTAHRTAWLVDVFRVLAVVAGPPGLGITLGIVVVWLTWRTRRPDTLVAGLAVLLVDAIESLIKVIVARPRPPSPFPVFDVHAFGASYPSGHSTQSAAIYGFLAVLCWRSARRSVRWIGASGAILLVGLVGFSRLYLGVHWLSDVLGGLLLGASWLFLVVSGQRWLTHRARTKSIALPT